MAPLRFAPCAVLVTAVALNGCGGADGEPSTAQPSSTPTPAASSNATILMKDLKFVPERVRVSVGETVTWQNGDSLDHNVVAKKGAKFRSRAFGHAGTYAYTPRKTGRIDYVCTLHPDMRGRLTVVRGRS